MDVEMREIKVAVVTISTETTTFLGHSFGNDALESLKHALIALASGAPTRSSAH